MEIGLGQSLNQGGADFFGGVAGQNRGNVDALVGISDPNAGMQPEERAALEQEQNALNESRQQILSVLRQQNLLSPQLLASLGFATGPDGRITDQGAAGGTMAEVFGGGPEQQRINQLLRQRQIASLEGNTPVDPGLERNLAKEEEILRNQLQAQLGSGYETSTPGMQALADFRQRATESRYNVGKDALVTSAGLNNTNLLTAGNLSNMRMQNVFGASNLSLPTLGALNTNTGQFTAPLTQLNDIFGRRVNAQLTQEKTRLGHGQGIASMF